jgi:anti-sigma B factor antagonist
MLARIRNRECTSHAKGTPPAPWVTSATYLSQVFSKTPRHARTSKLPRRRWITVLDHLRDSKTFADLTLTVRDHGPATVVELTGEFDAYTAFELRRYLALYPSGRLVHVVMDLRKLGFVDSAGIAVIVALSKQASARQGTLRLVIPENHLLVKLRRMGLVKLWPIYQDVESAVDAVTRISQTAIATASASADTGHI